MLWQIHEGKFCDCILTKQKGLSQKYREGNNMKQDAAITLCLTNPLPVILRCRPFILRPNFLWELVSFIATLGSPKEFKAALTWFVFSRVFLILGANMNNIWFVKLWKCTYTPYFSECQHIQYIYWRWSLNFLLFFSSSWWCSSIQSSGSIPQLSALSIMVLLGHDCHCSILRWSLLYYC